MVEFSRRNSLWLRLMGAFLLVILLGSIVDAFIVSQATRTQFDRYVIQNGQAFARQLAPALTAYYARNGSWQGVEAVLQSPWQGMMGMNNDGWTGPGMMGDMGSNQGWGNGSDMGDMMEPARGNTDSWMANGDMWGMMDIRLLLADGQGRVVADTLSSAVGTMLSPADLAAGYPLQLDNRQIGTLLAVSATQNVTSPGDSFLKSLNASTWLAGLAAAAMALVVGSLLFRQIVAPVKAVTVAARRIAAGELNQRIPVTSRDEVGQLAGAFNQMADALNHDRQLRQNMIADIAHELRTPLSVIQGNLEAMLDGVLPANPQEIASLHDETTLLSRLVADLRLLSLAEAGQLKLERAETDLGDLIRRTTDAMRPQADAAAIRLEADLPPNLPRISLDADRISQVIRNLVANALRHTPAGGSVSVRAFSNQQASQNKPAVVVEVTDTGSGIAPEDLPFVFERFYRADKSRSRASGGSGIGLAIVKQLVEAHGGRVWVESPVFVPAEGTQPGTRFSFTLPV